MHSEKKALEKSFDILEEKLEVEIDKNKVLIDSIEKAKKVRSGIIEARDKEIATLLAEIDSLLNKQDETPIDNMRDPDSIAELFARHYPDHTRTGEGGD